MTPSPLAELVRALERRNECKEPVYDRAHRIAVLNTAREALPELKSLLASNQWIPCGERMPPKSGDYLVFEEGFKDPQDGVSEMYYNEDLGEPDCWTDALEGPVTHWRPLPQPPRRSENE